MVAVSFSLIIEKQIFENMLDCCARSRKLNGDKGKSGMLSQIGNIAETEGPPPSSLKNKQYFDDVSLINSFTMIFREKGDG